MRLEEDRYEDVVILRFAGEFDTFSLPAFSERIDSMIKAGDTRLVVDAQHLQFMNDAALGYLIKTLKTVSSKGGAMVLARPSSFVRDMLSSLGLEGVFRIFETVEDAVTALH